MHEQLQADRPVVISAIVGMGGIGKTELALQYAFQHLETYPGGICWLKGREVMAVEILRAAADWHGLRPRSDLEDAARVQDCWRRWPQQPTLVVMDDVRDYEQIQDLLTPPRSQFRVLLTSRSKFDPPINNYEIKVLSPEASIELLQSLVTDGRIDRELAIAQDICANLGYLPLALELVGRYLAKRDLSLVKLWAQLQGDHIQSKALAMQKMNGGMTAKLGVIAAFELSWEGLSEAAQRLAAFLSLFALAAIPWELVEACWSEQEAEALAELRDLELYGASVLERWDTGVYGLHQLLREFFGLKLQSLPEWDDFRGRFARELTARAKTVPQVVTLAEQARVELLLPHWVIVTDYGRFLADDDKTWCSTALARVYESLSQFQSAEVWREKSLAISEEQLGENHPDTATSLNNLAELYRVTDNYTEAEPLYLRSLAIREEQLGTNHLYTAQSINNLAGLYCYTGRYAEAEPLYLRSLALYEKRLGANHPDTATSLNNLAGLYCYTSRYAEAESLFVRSLAIAEEQLGANHPDTAQSINNLAVLYCATGRYAEADLLYVRSLAIREEQLGENHPDTAQSINNLAALYCATGRYTEAEPLYVRLLAISEEQLGENHPDTAQSINNLAFLYFSMSKYAKAEPLYARSLQILETTLGQDHPNTQTVRENLAILRQQKD